MKVGSQQVITRKVKTPERNVRSGTCFDVAMQDLALLLRRKALLAPLSNKICQTLQLSDDVEACENCRATIDQMDSEIAAVDALRAGVIRELQELATLEKKIVRVRVSSVLGSVVETPEDVEQAVERLKEHLLKLLAEDTRIVLE